MRVFFDSNVFLHHLADTKDEATELLERVEDGTFEGIVNDIVVSEVIYGYLRATSGLKPYELRKKILIIDMDLKPVEELFGLFKLLPCNFGVGLTKFIKKYKLLPNDALIAATCKHYGIKKIATFDEDFRRVEFLEVVEL
ncbi:type II toxin-antitoxin system VapC family toxin [Archaeoglobus fulgidus]|uniref:Ribonuclease VapC n=1 Tax=Archaeoglobus fulgidus DSM 8774 TaxID=1344584 RepID=A0A075WE40_ARCFL|nr:type II toxin-antitoxin system VapC family toxin [Archaeoglobus fulgidus]AIG97967.1 putative nucleic acid-binding protein [Archaeoglobus fulgidus DSM 8774]